MTDTVDELLAFAEERLLDCVSGVKEDFFNDNIDAEVYWDSVKDAAQFAAIVTALQGIKRPGTLPSPVARRRRELDLSDDRRDP